jgi:hypothetical protein
MVRCHPLSALLVWYTRDRLYYPLLGGEFLVSTNLPLWGLEEEKRHLVEPSLCGILNTDVTSFVGVNFGLNLCVSLSLLEFFVSL